MSQAPSREDAFARSSGKTYSLLELVRGPRTMVDKGGDDTVFAFPVVAMLELLLALGTAAILLVCSLLRDAPLEELANPLLTTDPAKAPWYFMGLQEMLEHMHPILAGVVIPALAVLFLLAVPYLDRDRAGAGVWFTDRRGRRIAGWTALYALIVMPAYVLLDNAFPPRELLRDTLPPLLTQSVIPGAVMALLVVLPVVLLKRLGNRTHTREVMTVLFTLLMVSALVLTVTGFFFRGPGFELYWPWNMPNGYNPLDSL